ncbi:hypothetical protein ACRE_029020 [Hapsidospora chrysogenum ATCC 11550]|uniref:Uncharacterized protein n=1 Tax=Hapsidospora chrysogenum (strain ATCC 11550 / CBS 779.69 / DSM 880 / IAM 14645 / JCM 23072 / IMI 49137) TaxID=857340 RepID=A0A086TAC9_HAPC1|nr:hypothetical protein ACRE_029020 [Hapsidospora chrysogenum ATCC 11550]
MMQGWARNVVSRRGLPAPKRHPQEQMTLTDRTLVGSSSMSRPDQIPIGAESRTGQGKASFRAVRPADVLG